MAVSRFKHSTRAVKSLAAAAVLTVAVCGAASAQDISTLGKCRATPLLQMTLAELQLCEGMEQSARRIGELRPRRKARLTPEEATALSGTIDPALYHGLPDANDPAELRRQREQGAREEAANHRRSYAREVPIR